MEVGPCFILDLCHSLQTTKENASLVWLSIAQCSL